MYVDCMIFRSLAALHRVFSNIVMGMNYFNFLLLTFQSPFHQILLIFQDMTFNKDKPSRQPGSFCRNFGPNQSHTPMVGRHKDGLAMILNLIQSKSAKRILIRELYSQKRTDGLEMILNLIQSKSTKRILIRELSLTVSISYKDFN